MRRWLLLRLLWCVLTLFGITFVTFVVMDLAPVDRAEREATQAAQDGTLPDAVLREAAVLRLRVRYGMVDPETKLPLPLWRRYTAWLSSAAVLQLAGPDADNAAFWRRLGEAAPVTLLLGGLSLLCVFVFGVGIGSWLGVAAGSKRDRVASGVLLTLVGMPEFLLATLLPLVFGSMWLQWLPTSGLRSPGSDGWSFGWQVVDFGRHLIMPVLVMALGPTVMVARFVRDSVARAAVAPFVTNLQALGIEPEVVRWRLLRHGLAPVATLAGNLLPMLVGGSIVVENLFGLDGLGHLAFDAVMQQDQATVMALVLVTSIITLLSLLASDVLHRCVDPRVRLQP
ncbi:MAG: ABC transporter permease [Planctomycetes bacterium]|nr:ABC transporter permease [Planctomycetota bacterium]MCC7395510.1 ABC transporter permease [Planctomycetota bacterium]